MSGTARRSSQAGSTTPHCDHLAAHRVAALARREAKVPHRAFPVWGLTLPPQTDLDTRPATGARLDVTRHLPAKRRAIRCHASQYAGLITDDRDGFQMEPAFMALFESPHRTVPGRAMTRRTESIKPAWFEQLYAGDPDPWRFATSDYERDKYAATLAALPARRFAAALEVGCSFGVLTRQLSPRCDHLLAIDVADAVLDRARPACPGVTFERRFVPDEWPPGRFDLILFSEVLYYLTEADIGRTARKATDALLPGGVILLVHYLGGDRLSDRGKPGG